VNGINKNWKSKKVEIPRYKTPQPPTKSQIYFYDVPDAKQSVIRFAYPALAQIDKDSYPAMISKARAQTQLRLILNLLQLLWRN